MITDLYLRVPHLFCKLTWFKENEFHTLFFSSQTMGHLRSELTMSIGSLVCWNFGEHVQSREFQYLLHCVSLQKKDEVMSNL